MRERSLALILSAACLIICVYSSLAFGDDREAKDEKIIGPPPMFEITAECDRARLREIELSLKQGEKKVVRYQYTLYLSFKDHKLKSTEIVGMDLPDSVKKCIIDGFLKSGKFKSPEHGLVPIKISFPAIVTPIDPFEEGRPAYEAGDYKKAYSIWKPLAERGNVKAQLALGGLYAVGNGVAKDVAVAQKWWRKAAGQGYDHAQYNLALAYKDGKEVKKDLTEAVKWWKKAADQGHVLSQYYLGLAYHNGEGVKKSNAGAIKWWRKAAEQNDIDSQYYLGVLYITSPDIKNDEKEGIRWIREAADNSHKKAAEFLAVAYENGWYGLAKDKKQSQYWHERALAK